MDETLRDKIIKAVNEVEDGDDKGSIIKACMDAIFDGTDTDELMEMVQRSRARARSAKGKSGMITRTIEGKYETRLTGEKMRKA